MSRFLNMAFKGLHNLSASAYLFDHYVLPLFNLSYVLATQLLVILHTLCASLPLLLLFPLSGMPFLFCCPTQPPSRPAHHLMLSSDVASFRRAFLDPSHRILFSLVEV